jgi:hypothetical protein
VEEEACPVSGVHSNHQELTVGKVDDVHHAKNDSESEGNQSKKKAHQDSLKECIKNDHKCNSKMPKFKCQIKSKVQISKKKISQTASQYARLTTLDFEL